MAVVQNGLLFSADPADSTIGDLFVIVNQDENVTVQGSAGPDRVDVSNYKETVTGYVVDTADGDDNINLQAGATNDLSVFASFVNANAGDDILNFDTFLSTTVFGGEGNDRIRPTGNFIGTAQVNTLIRLNDGDDFFNDLRSFANIEGSTINGNAGIDILRFSGGYLTNNVIHGGRDQDTINILINDTDTFRDNTVNGNRGNDIIIVDANENDAATNISDNTIFGGQGTDTINASLSDGNLFLSGDNGNDTITGGEGDDTILGGDGDDLIVTAGAGNDMINGNAGNDIITDGNGDDSVMGGQGNDDITILQGRDTVTGNLGSDRIRLGAFDNITDTIIQNNGDSTAASALNQTVGGVANVNGLTFAEGADIITGFEQGPTDGVHDRLEVEADIDPVTNPVNFFGAIDFTDNTVSAFAAGTVNVIYGTITTDADGNVESFLSAAGGPDSFVVVGNNGLMNINSNGFFVDNIQVVAADFA